MNINNITFKLFAILTFTTFACGNQKNQADAYGTFEATEIMVASQSNGEIISSFINEGDIIKMGQLAYVTDTMQLHLKLKQLSAQLKALLIRKPNVSIQLEALQVQLKQAEHEQNRINKLFASNAATAKQKDDADAMVRLIKSQLQASESGLSINTNSINEDAQPILIQMEQTRDLLKKCSVYSPIKGTVLNTYIEKGEIATLGKQLFKIAYMEELYLRAYITGDLFAKLKLNSSANVLVDDGKGGFKTYDGTVTWISNKAEFTPKTIQTKDERANLVYAVKVKVKNDGFIKIGMYGELKL